MKLFRPSALCATLLVGCFFSLGEQARAAFHAMQIEQVIGGVEGDTSAQAIQLRMRAAGHNITSSSRIRAWDATGANPIVIADMETNVANGAAASRILITTPNFDNYVAGAVVSDFTMVPIPASYLAAGRLTFETDNGAIIYWSLAWGGAGYTGSNTGNDFNDLDGNFGPPFAGAMPSATRSALRINLPATGAASRSTNNAANYAVTPGSATFTNNAGASYLVIPEPTSLCLLLGCLGTLVCRRPRRG